MDWYIMRFGELTGCCIRRDKHIKKYRLDKDFAVLAFHNSFFMGNKSVL